MLVSTHIIRAILIGAVLATLSYESSAREEATIYQIELLVVKHTDYQAGALERVINPMLAHRLQQPAPNVYQEESDDGIQRIDNPQRLQLNKYKEKLYDSDLFEVLLHIAWEQPPYRRDEAKYINILGEPTAGLIKGLAWASYEQYFQLRLDFQYDTSLQQELQALDVADSKDSMVLIHMKKIMKDDELYYLDHPTIGVLAYITAVTEEMRSSSTSTQVRQIDTLTNPQL